MLASEEGIEISSPASLSPLRELVRSRCHDLPGALVEQIASLATSIAKAQLAGPLSGEMALRRIKRDGVAGLELIAFDAGALVEEHDDQPALLRLLASLAGDGLESDIDVRAGLGRLLRVRAFAAAVRRAPEVGIYGRPMPGQGVSGDEALILREGDALRIAVVDGLGHGARAAEAAVLAIDTFAQACKKGLSAALVSVDDALQGTRGAVMRAASVSWPGGEIETVGAGNIGCAVLRADGLQRCSGNGFTLGDRIARPKLLRADVMPLNSSELFLLFTDGVSSRLSVDAESPMMAQHPALIAAQLCETYAKATDDALLVVIR